MQLKNKLLITELQKLRRVSFQPDLANSLIIKQLEEEIELKMDDIDKLEIKNKKLENELKYIKQNNENVNKRKFTENLNIFNFKNAFDKKSIDIHNLPFAERKKNGI